MSVHPVKADITARLARLNERERAIIRMRLGQGKSLSAIAKRLKLSNEQVRQDEERALRKLWRRTRNPQPFEPWQFERDCEFAACVATVATGREAKPIVRPDTRF